MSVLVDKNTRLLVQGITGKTGAFHAKQSLEYGTAVVGGVTPGKGGERFEGKVPIFDTVADAVKETGANASVIFVPPPYAADAIMEAADAGVPLEHVDDQPVMTPRVLSVARRVLHRENLRLVEALEELGTRARPVTAGVFEARIDNEEKYGLLGSIERVHLEAIESSLRAGHLPIVAALGETPGGQIVDIDPAAAARELALTIQPYKVVFLTESGGILDGEDRVVSAVNLAEDWEALSQQPWLGAGMRMPQIL